MVVFRRPGLAEFLQRVSEVAELVVFTAGVPGTSCDALRRSRVYAVRLGFGCSAEQFNLMAWLQSPCLQTGSVQAPAAIHFTRAREVLHDVTGHWASRDMRHQGSDDDAIVHTASQHKYPRHFWLSESAILR